MKNWTLCDVYCDELRISLCESSGYVWYWVNKQKKIVSRWQLVEPAILSETFPWNSINERSHQHGQHRKNWKPYSVGRLLLSLFLIWGTDRWNGNDTELTPIQSVVIPVTNKIGRAQSGSPICSLRASLQTKLDDAKSYYKLIINIYYFPAILEGQKSGEAAKSSL